MKRGELSEGGVRGIRTLQNCTDICINATQNNIRKPQTALKLPENFSILQTAWFCKTVIAGGVGGTLLQEAIGDVPLDGVAFSRLD